MNRMRFDVPCVKECLVKNKIVYTVRSWQGYGLTSKVEVDRVGSCTKKRVLKVSRKEDLAKYLSLSGFSSLDEWWAKIRSFGACEGWLFEVKVEERKLKCPQCGELMPTLLLNDLNKCDNCGCPAQLFDWG